MSSFGDRLGKGVHSTCVFNDFLAVFDFSTYPKSKASGREASGLRKVQASFA